MKTVLIVKLRRVDAPFHLLLAMMCLSGICHSQEDNDGIETDWPFDVKDPRERLSVGAYAVRLPPPSGLPGGFMCGLSEREFVALPAFVGANVSSYPHGRGRVSWNISNLPSASKPNASLSVDIISYFPIEAIEDYGLTDKQRMFYNALSPSEHAFQKLTEGKLEQGANYAPFETYEEIGIASVGHASLFHRRDGHFYNITFCRRNVFVFLWLSPIEASGLDLVSIAREIDNLLSRQPVYEQWHEVRKLFPVIAEFRPEKSELRQGDCTSFIVRISGADPGETVSYNPRVFPTEILAQTENMDGTIFNIYGFTTNSATTPGNYTFLLETVYNSRGLWVTAETVVKVLPENGQSGDGEGDDGDQDDNHDDRSRGDDDHPGKGHDNSLLPGVDEDDNNPQRPRCDDDHPGQGHDNSPPPGKDKKDG